jgi:hypothetical protein
VNEFTSTVERHRHELLLHCCRILGSLQDAEDAVQETLIRAWRSRDSLKEGAPREPLRRRADLQSGHSKQGEWKWVRRLETFGSTRVHVLACLESMSVVWFPASSETFQ